MATTVKTPSSKADTTPDLSLPSFDDELPKDWQDLAPYALGDDGDEEDPQTMTTTKNNVKDRCLLKLPLILAELIDPW